MVHPNVKRMALAIALAGSTFVAGIAPAAAGDKKVGTCPDGFAQIPTSTYPNFGPGIDKNGDGKLCRSPLPNSGNGGFNVIDNMAAPHQD